MADRSETDGSMPAPYLPRVIDRELDALLPHLPAILLDGPKGVGKTATALRRAHAGTILRLDQPAARQVVEADPDAALIGTEPVLIDEWQQVPTVFDAVKRAVDTDPRGGRFLLTGSAATPAHTTHSGAGRITTLRMRSMTLPERGLTAPTVSLAELLDGHAGGLHGTTAVDLVGYTHAILASGLPGLRGLQGRALRVALDGYLDRIVHHEVAQAGLSLRAPQTLRSWLAAYAAATATAVSWDKIRDAATAGEAAKPAKSTTQPYRDTLTMLRVLDDLPAWLPAASPLRRLTQGPKHHLADPALAARLLGATAESMLSGSPPQTPLPHSGPLLGALFESLCVQSVRVFAQAAEARTFHLRTRDSLHEIDTVVERADGTVVAIEAKLAAAVRDADVRHLTWLRDQLGAQVIDLVVLNTGPQAYRRTDGVAVVPLALLGP